MHHVEYMHSSVYDLLPFVNFELQHLPFAHPFGLRENFEDQRCDQHYIS